MKKDGKYYWLVPFVFISIYTGIGVLLFSHMRFITFSINGHPSFYAFPTNYLLWYNTSTGPLSSIFLSNFIWDGWDNILFFIIYATIFTITITLSRHRMQIAVFSFVGAIIVGALDMTVIRLVLPKGIVTYGQSTILAGFAGITIFYMFYEIIYFYEDYWKKWDEIIAKHKNGFGRKIGYVYAGIYMFFMDIALILLVSFVSPALPMLTNEIHAIGLILGITMAGAFAFLTEQLGRKKARMNIESESISGGA